jgi:hypothetical protein
MKIPLVFGPDMLLKIRIHSQVLVVMDSMKVKLYSWRAYAL